MRLNPPAMRARLASRSMMRGPNVHERGSLATYLCHVTHAD
jgi:hypothetical protein